VTLSYNGTILHETLVDATTSAHSEFFYLVNLPQVVGASTAYIGFTAQSSFPDNQQYVSNFQYVPEPSTFALLAIGPIVPLWRLLRRRLA
jgi:hypothetical protein